MDDLLSGLEAVQQKKSMIRLSERNVIELVTKLRQLGFIGDDLLHTINGREFITRDKLQEEVISAIDAAGGRLPLVDLPSLIGVDLAHCERAAEHVVSTSSGSVIQAQGELLTTKYFDAIALDVEDALQGSGVVVLGDLARRCSLGVEMLQGVLLERMGKIVHGRLASGVIYTDAYLLRIKAQVRGALRGALAPISLSTVRKDLGIESLGGLGALVPTVAEELLREGAIVGKLAAGGSWVPASFARSQQEFILSFFQQNGYVSYDMAAKYGVSNTAQFLSGTFPEGQSLSTAFVSPSVVHQIEAAVEEAIQSSTWCDVMNAAPGSLTSADVAQLLEKCVVSSSSSSSSSSISSAGDVKIFSETCAVSSAFLESLRMVLCEEAKKAAQEAHAAKKAAAKTTTKTSTSAPPPAAATAAPPSSKKGGGKGKPVSAPGAASDDDDDWDMGGKGGGKGKKGGKGGKKGASSSGGGANKSAAAKTTKSQIQQQQQQQQSSNSTKASSTSGSAATASILSLYSIEKRIVELHPDTEGAGAEADLPTTLAEALRPAVVAEYERALSDIFTAGAERRRRLREASSSRLTTSYQNFQLFAHGADLFAQGEEEEATTHVTLQRYLMQSAAPACVDSLLHLLSADVAEEVLPRSDGSFPPATPEEQVLTSLPQSERTAIVRGCAPEAQSAVEAAVKALTAAASVTSAADFMTTLEAAGEAVGLRLKRLDKKTEVALVQGQLAALRSQAEGAGNGPTLLAVAVPLLISKYRGRCVSLPGKALPDAVEVLRSDLDEEQHAVLVEYHAAVVESLRESGDGAGDGGVSAKLESLEPRIRALLV